jgi:hypothetical protein
MKLKISPETCVEILQRTDIDIRLYSVRCRDSVDRCAELTLRTTDRRLTFIAEYNASAFPTLVMDTDVFYPEASKDVANAHLSNVARCLFLSMINYSIEE